MSDERYKKGFQEYLRPFGFDPDQYNEWLLKRVRQEEKRLNMITLVPVGVGVFLAALRYLIVEVTFTPHIWETTINFFAVFLICYLYFIISARMHFSKVKKMRTSFLQAWRKYLKSRLDQYPLLVAGLWPASYSLINITYDSGSGWVVKAIVSLLVALAAWFLLRTYVHHDYSFCYKESQDMKSG